MASIIKNGRVYSGFGGGGSGGNFVEMTQAQYNALVNPDPETVYFITDEDANNDIAASGVEYDNTDSGLTADTVQDAIDENASDIENLKLGLTVQITFNSGYQGLSDAPVSLVKRGEFCILNGNVWPTSGSIPSNAWVDIFTIPTEYRPNVTRTFDSCVYGGGNKYLTTLRGQVASNGIVSVFNYQQINETIVRLSFNVTYETLA